MHARLVVAALVLGSAAPVSAQPDVGEKQPPAESHGKLLTAAEVQKSFAPYAPAVLRCYLTHAKNREATGTLRLELIIHRDGSVFRFGFVAPGVRKPWLSRLDGCLREKATTWRFPVRYGFTSAMLPFIYVKSNSPGAGPFESCWSPSGCPSRPPKGKR